MSVMEGGEGEGGEQSGLTPQQGCNGGTTPTPAQHHPLQGFFHFLGDYVPPENSEKMPSVKKRLDPEFRERERVKNLERTRRLRMNPDFRDKERVRNRVNKQRARLDPAYREAERLRNRLQKRRAREDPAYREAERLRNLWQKRRAREDPQYRMKERMKDLERRRMKQLGWYCDPEWMDMPVVMDQEARVAFDYGVYRFLPNNWDGRLPPVKEEPDWYDTQAQTKAPSWHLPQTEDSSTDGSDLSSEGPSFPLDDSQSCHVSSEMSPPKGYPTTCSRYGLSVSHTYPPARSRRPFQLPSSLCISDDIEILPLPRCPPNPCPSLNWQIEVLRIVKSNKQTSKYPEPPSTFDYSKPPIQV